MGRVGGSSPFPLRILSSRSGLPFLPETVVFFFLPPEVFVNDLGPLWDEETDGRKSPDPLPRVRLGLKG